MSQLAPQLRRNLWWQRDSRNPVLPLGEEGSYDATACMNPYVLRKGDEYYLYYAGGDREGRRRICLATAPVANPAKWHRHGPLFDLGAPGSFDARWCVLPHVVQFAPDRWHLYYTGNSGVGEGLSAFPGMGLAVSTDGKTWEKYAGNPILAPTGIDGDPDAKGIAGGSVIKARLPDGSTEWRFYYTGCPTVGEDLFLNQQKCCCFAVSQDGIHWERRGAVMLRDPERDYENVAAAGPVVMQNSDGSYRMWYSAIGTRWGAYSIAYAESPDGINWVRGKGYGDNLQLGPIGTGWERQMVEYPTVIQEGDRLRLFYCGNGYGGSGIGTALSSPLRATPADGCGEVDVVSETTQQHWRISLPSVVSSAEGTITELKDKVSRWHGPDAKGMLWYEWSSSHPSAQGTEQATEDKAQQNADVAQVLSRLRCRVLLTPLLEGLEVRFSLANGSDQAINDLTLVVGIQQTTSEAQSDRALQIRWEGDEDSRQAPAAARDSDPSMATVVLGNVAPGVTLTRCGVISLS